MLADMTTRLQTHLDPATADEAVQDRRDAGVPEPDMWLTIGSLVRDVRHQRVGGFAGPIAPHALVGSFGNVPQLRAHGAGAFAGDAARRRQGSFSDAHRTIVVR